MTPQTLKGLRTLGHGLTLAGGAMGGLGVLNEAAGESRSLTAQAEAKEAQAAQLREQGAVQGVRMNEENRRLLAEQRALYGEAGVTMEGAPELLTAQSRAAFVADRMTFSRNVASEIGALLTEAHDLRRAARRVRKDARMGAFASFMGAAAGVLA